MRLAHQFAVESDLISADMVEVTEFPHLAQRFEVRGVPRTVVNGRAAIDGAVAEEMFLEAVLDVARQQA